MPKRVGYLYDAMINKDLIRAAILDGAKNKRNRWDVRPVLEDIDGYVDEIYAMLQDGLYTPSKPEEKMIFDQCGQKERAIYVTPFFPDGIMNQLVVAAMKPVIMRGMYYWSCASVPGRGGAHAMKKVKSAIRSDPKGTRYCLKIDVKHFYPSVDRNRLIWALARKIKDKKFLKLVWDMVNTCPKGLAIGYYMNQWLANFYLEPLDHYITTLPGVKHMVRYMDDIVMLGSNKRLLHKARNAIETFLADRLSLRMKGDWQVFPVKARPVDFVGYKFYRTYTTLRRRNFLKFARQCRKVKKRLDNGQKLSYKTCAGLLSRTGQLKHCDSYKIRVKYLDPIKIKHLKEVVRSESKRRQSAA